MELIDLLGTPAPAAKICGEKIAEEEVDGMLVETYSLTLNSLETVPAICVRPQFCPDSPLPVVLYQHSHGGNFKLGKSECLQGAEYLQQKSFAKELTVLGYAVWAIDAWCFEERGGITEAERYKEFLLTGKTLWGMRLFDCMALIDFLETREDLDTTRLASIGLSMGGLLSWWLAALDHRVKVCIDLAAQVDTETLIAERRLDHHGFYYYLPNLVTYFTTAEIQAKIVPRKRLSIVGQNDVMCPASGVKKLNEYMTTRYKQADAAENFVGTSVSGGHQETAAMRVRWRDFLKEHL